MLIWIYPRSAARMLAVALVCLAFVAIARPVRAIPLPDETESKSESESETDVDAGGDREYYELFKLLADTLDQIERNYVKPVDRRQLVDAAIRGMLSELDQYSSYIPPPQLDRFRTRVEAEFGGVGIQVTVDKGQLRVISPIVGSPAYRGGMMSGDVILEIDDQDAQGVTIDEAVQRMKGKPGTEVKVKVLHPGSDEPEVLTLRREVVRVETVLGDVRDDSGVWKWMIDDDRQIGYIRVTAFGRHTTEELSKAIGELIDQGLRGLVLDLRFNPGGLLTSAIEVCDLFVAEGRIVSTEGRNTPIRTWDAKPEGTYPEFPMAVLINRYSASASEIVAACLQDHQRAVIVGERSWGKGSVQNVVELEQGVSALKLTTADYRRPNGKNIHRFADLTEDDPWGVLPDDGYELILTDAEIARWTADRRRKDIVRRPGDAAGDLLDNEAQAPSVDDPQDPQAPSDRDTEAPSDRPADGDAADESSSLDRQLDRALEYLAGRLAESDAVADRVEQPAPETAAAEMEGNHANPDD